MADVTDALKRNARISVEACLDPEKGETLLIVSRGAFSRDARAVSLGAVELGVHPIIMDLDEYLANGFKQGKVLEPFVAALEASDMAVAIAWCASFGALLGKPEENDYWLTGKERAMYMMCGAKGVPMEDWDLDFEEVAAIRPRTEALLDMVLSADRIRVTAPAGTDFSFSMGPKASAHPILGIAPLYGEVAITPAHGSESGVVAVDMATQMDVRPRDELDREPLRIIVRDGCVVDCAGDPAQVQRFREYMASGDPPARNIDEVGIPTTTIKINDLWWRDGCHFTETVHIAPGNKTLRDTRVHGARHMDGQLSKPTIMLDGEAIMKDGKFIHEALQ